MSISTLPELPETDTETLRAHPYAEAWPLLGAEELDALAEDIATNDLRDAIVLYQGLILDGRNRYAACQKAGVEPHFTEFDGGDDAALAFVQSANNARRHQSKGSLAASWALSMLAAGKRKKDSEGKLQWAFRKRRNFDGTEPSRDNRMFLGTIADHAPDLLVEVRDDGKTLNAAYDLAVKARDEERDNLEWEKRIEAEESDAKAFLLETAPEYAKRVDSGEFHNHVAAKSKWEHDNREEAAKRRREQEEARLKEQRRIKDLNHTYGTIANALRVIGNWGKYDTEALNRLMADYSPKYLSLEDQDRYFQTENLASAATFIEYLTKYQEQNNA